MAVRRFVPIAALAAVLPLAALSASPAAAVQTRFFGLAASGNRDGLVHAATGGTVHDSVVVSNLTAAPMTVDLSVEAASYRKGSGFSYGGSGGLASRVSLSTTKVDVPAHGQRTVSVRIDTGDPTTDEYAAIAAEQDVPTNDAVTVVEQLVVIVAVTPHHGSIATSPGGIVAEAVAAALIAAGLVALVRSRRRRDAAGSEG